MGSRSIVELYEEEAEHFAAGIRLLADQCCKLVVSRRSWLRVRGLSCSRPRQRVREGERILGSVGGESRVGGSRREEGCKAEEWVRLMQTGERREILLILTHCVQPIAELMVDGQ